MDRLHAMSVFVSVVEQGSFARAAEKLDLSTSAVSRHVADLETHLQTRLLNRTTRRLSLTESGRGYHERCVQLLADLEEAEQNATAAAVVPRGTLRLTSSIVFGSRYLAPAIAEFAGRHPQLEFDVELSDRAVDIVEEGMDLAVRIGAIGSQALIARRIASTRMVLCASPEYLRRFGEPRTPAELADHSCLTYEYLAVRDTWRFRDAEGGDHAVRVQGRAHANNGRFLAALALEGVGILFEPDFIVDDEIRSGRLVRLLPQFTPAASDIYAAYPSRRHLSAKVRAFVDFLAERFAGAPPWSLDATGS